MQEQFSMDDMVRKLGVTKGRIENAIKKLKMKPVKRIGRLRFWTWAQMVLICEKILDLHPVPKKIRANR